jgi:hypothetical protein
MPTARTVVELSIVYNDSSDELDKVKSGDSEIRYSNKSQSEQEPPPNGENQVYPQNVTHCPHSKMPATMPPLPHSTRINLEEDLEVASSMLKLMKQQQQGPPSQDDFEQANNSSNKMMASSPSFFLQQQDGAEHQTHQNDTFRYYSNDNYYTRGTNLSRDDPYVTGEDHYSSETPETSGPSFRDVFQNHAGGNDNYSHFPRDQAKDYLYHQVAFSPAIAVPPTIQHRYNMMPYCQHFSSSYVPVKPHFQDSQRLHWGTHQGSKNFQCSLMSIHENAGSYSQLRKQRTSSIDGNTMNQFQHISKISADGPDFHTTYDQRANKSQKFNPPNKTNHTGTGESPHSSARARKTFSLQTIYQAINRHIRGTNEEYQKPNNPFLDGVRREGYISDIRRANIKGSGSSRKRANEESIESTEISSMTTSSSILSSYRERKIPSEVFRNDSNSFAQIKLGPSSVTHDSLIPRYREPLMLGMTTDADHISEFLQFLRAECCQVFTAGRDEVFERRKSKPVVMNQVGIRCAFCAHKPYNERAARSSCYPSCLDRIYQSIVMMVRDHFSICPHFPPEVRKTYELIKSASRRRRDVDSRQYWAISAKSLGISETDKGLIFK